MNMVTLVQTLRDGLLVDDSDLADWTDTEYDKALTVFIGIDERQPPAFDQYPMVAIEPTGKAAGFGMEQQVHELSITVGLYDETINTDTTNLVEMAGFEMVEEFRKLVEENIITNLPSDVRLDGLEIDYAVGGPFPYSYAVMQMRLVSDYYQGADPFA